MPRQAQLQKMESLGRLVGGIAHDFNNIIGIVMPNVDLLKISCPDNQEVQKRAGNRTGSCSARLAIDPSVNDVLQRSGNKISSLVAQRVDHPIGAGAGKNVG